MKPHLMVDYEGPPSRCSFGITEALAFIGTDLLAAGAADAGATGLAAVGAGAAETAAGVSFADLAAGAGAAGLGAADLAGGFGGADLAGGFGGIGGADLTASPLGFAGTTGAAAANPLADLSAAGLTAPGAASAGVAPAAAGPIDLASSFTAASDSLNPLNWTGFSITDPVTGATGGGTFTDAGVAGGSGAAGASPASSIAGGDAFDLAGTGGGVAGAGPTAATGGGTDLAALAGPPGAGAPTGGATAASSGGNIFDSLVGGATKQITSNPLGLAIGAGGLGYNILQGQKTSANENALKAAAGNEANAGAQLQNYINTGTLPPGMQAQVDQAKAAAKARIISGYASRGQNSDPAQNSALAQELSAVDTNAVALQGQLATNLLTAGIQETGMSNNLYEALIQMDQTQAQNMGKAIANFAGALAPRTSINIGGGSGA